MFQGGCFVEILLKGVGPWGVLAIRLEKNPQAPPPPKNGMGFQVAVGGSGVRRPRLAPDTSNPPPFSAQKKARQGRRCPGWWQHCIRARRGGPGWGGLGVLEGCLGVFWGCFGGGGGRADHPLDPGCSGAKKGQEAGGGVGWSKGIRRFQLSLPFEQVKLKMPDAFDPAGQLRRPIGIWTPGGFAAGCLLKGVGAGGGALPIQDVAPPPPPPAPRKASEQKRAKAGLLGGVLDTPWQVGGVPGGRADSQITPPTPQPKKQQNKDLCLGDLSAPCTHTPPPGAPRPPRNVHRTPKKPKFTPAGKERCGGGAEGQRCRQSQQQS
jgi:hypothetical protein